MNKHQILYPLIFVVGLMSGGLIGLSNGTTAGFDAAVNAMHRGYLQGVREASVAQTQDVPARAEQVREGDAEFRRSLLYFSPMPVTNPATPLTKQP